MTRGIAVERARPADFPEIADADGRAFGFHYTDTDLEDARALIDPDRFLLVRDGGEPVGVTGSFPFTLTLPGGGTVPTEGVTWVSVAVTHRRRGVLRELMTVQHRGFAEAGVPLALLTASEGGIYGRFGYAPASERRDTEIDRPRAAFRDGVPDPGGVRYARTEDVPAHAAEVHRRWCAGQVGALSRSDAWWRNALLDREHQRRGGSALFHLVHPDGYASYRIHDGGDTCQVVALFAATPDAHVALWRVLLALDLVSTIRIDTLTGDDPLPWLLRDARVVRTTGIRDDVWARVLDVPAVLRARRYATELDVVLDVHDGFLDRRGRVRLRGGPDGAECHPTDATPDLHVDIAALGALTLGGARAATLARAGLLTGTPAALARLDLACVPEHEPRAGTRF